MATNDQVISIDQWGQDPMFVSFSKMYIGDIVNINEHRAALQEPGVSGGESPSLPVFSYLGHPVWKVDVLGVVVKAEQKERFNNYSLDDGTGVLNCTHWKKQKDITGTMANLPSTLRSLGLDLERLHEETQQGYALGDLLHVRGRLKRFRGNVELTASYVVKIESANAEIVRMLRLPDIYHECYDKPSKIKSFTNDQNHHIYMMRKKLLELLRGSTKMEMYYRDLEELKKSLPQDYQTSPVFADAWKVAVQQMFDEGHLYPVMGRQQEFRVVLLDQDLRRRIMDVLQTESRKVKNSEKGCHYLRVLDELKGQRQFAQLNGAALLRVLEQLEANSEVFSPVHKHFLLLDS